MSFAPFYPSLAFPLIKWLDEDMGAPLRRIFRRPSRRGPSYGGCMRGLDGKCVVCGTGDCQRYGSE